MTLNQAIKKGIIFYKRGCWNRVCQYCKHEVRYPWSSNPKSVFLLVDCKCSHCFAHKWKKVYKVKHPLVSASPYINQRRKSVGTVREIRQGELHPVRMSVYDVELSCPCGYKDRRGTPDIPWTIRWNCPTCRTNYRTTFV